MMNESFHLSTSLFHRSNNKVSGQKCTLILVLLIFLMYPPQKYGTFYRIPHFHKNKRIKNTIATYCFDFPLAAYIICRVMLF